MPYLNPKPGDASPGAKRVSAEALNQVRDATPRQISGSGRANVNKVGDRFLVSVDDQPPRYSRTSKLFKVVEEFEDYVTAIPYTPNAPRLGQNHPTYEDDPESNEEPEENGYTPSENAAMVAIAKPYLLQQTAWDGKSVMQYGNTYEYDYNLEIGQRNTTVTDSDDNSSGFVEEITPAYFKDDIITADPINTGIAAEGAGIVWMDANLGSRNWQQPSAVVGTIWQLGLIDATSLAGPAAGFNSGAYVLNIYKTKDIAKVNNKPANGQVTAFALGQTYFWNGELVGWSVKVDGTYIIQKLWFTGITVDPSLLCCRPCTLTNNAYTAADVTTLSQLTLSPPPLCDWTLPYLQTVKLCKLASASQPVYILSNQNGFLWMAAVSFSSAAVHIANGSSTSNAMAAGPAFLNIFYVVPSSVTCNNLDGGITTTQNNSDTTNVFSLTANAGSVSATAVLRFVAIAAIGTPPNISVPSGNGAVVYSALMYAEVCSLTGASGHIGDLFNVLTPPFSGFTTAPPQLFNTITAASWVTGGGYMPFTP